MDFQGYAIPSAFAWKWDFCQEWLRLGGVADDLGDLAQWASRVYQQHMSADPLAVARQLFAVSHAARTKRP